MPARTTGRMPDDLGRWLLRFVAEHAADYERRDARDALIRAAAGMLDGSTWARAGILAREIEAMERRRSSLAGARALLAEALAIDPACPRTQRHLYRILAD